MASNGSGGNSGSDVIKTLIAIIGAIITVLTFYFNFLSPPASPAGIQGPDVKTNVPMAITPTIFQNPLPVLVLQKTYQYSQAGFSFNYPETWKLETDGQYPVSFKSPDGRCVFYLRTVSISRLTNIDTARKDLTAMQILISDRENGIKASSQNKFSEVKSITIAGLPAAAMSSYLSSSTTYEVAFIHKNNVTYISIESLNQDLAKNQEIFNEILATIKF